MNTIVVWFSNFGLDLGPDNSANRLAGGTNWRVATAASSSLYILLRQPISRVMRQLRLWALLSSYISWCLWSRWHNGMKLKEPPHVMGGGAAWSCQTGWSMDNKVCHFHHPFQIRLYESRSGDRVWTMIPPNRPIRSQLIAQGRHRVTLFGN